MRPKSTNPPNPSIKKWRTTRRMLAKFIAHEEGASLDPMVDRAKDAARISYVRNGVESVHFPKSPAAFLATPFAHRQLLRELVKRDALGRYRGSFLGLFWSFLSPLLM